MDQKINMAFIGTYPQMSETFLQITSDVPQIEAVSIDASFEKAVEEAKKIESSFDIILSRGGTGEYIRTSVDIPVIFIPITPFDVAKVLHTLPKKTKRVALIYYHRNTLNVKELEEMYDIEITEYHFDDYGDIENSIRDADDKGIDTIIGGNVASKIALKYSMKSHVVSAGYAAISRAVDEAIQVVLARRKEQAQTARLGAAFSSLIEGVVVIDDTQQIVLNNPISRKLFGAQCAIGKKPAGALGTEQFRKIFAKPGNLTETSEILSIKNETYVATYTPVRIKGQFIGMVNRYEDVTKIQKLEQKVRKELHAKGFLAKHTFDDMIGTSPEMQRVTDMAKTYATVDSSILIEGESGTGKEYLAQSIHNESPRKNGPFVAVNCTAIPENLLESELFGYEAGAFTGARKEGRAGLFEMAHGGTLFLDEIGEITEQLQTSLLRVLQEREIMRVGGNKIIPIDVRVISATNRDLWRMVQAGDFRADLYFRLNVFHLQIPPLRSRTGDISVLAKHYLEKAGVIPEDSFFETVVPRLEQYGWPGNVREMQSVMERYLLLSKIREIRTLSPDEIDVLLGLNMLTGMKEPAPEEVHIKEAIHPEGELKDLVAAFESEVIQKAIEDANGNQALAARKLGIGKTTMWRKLKA